MNRRLARPRSFVSTFIVVGTLALGVGCSETTGTALPNPPNNVTATLVARNRIGIAWDARPGSERIVAYSIYRDGLKIGESQSVSYVDATAAEVSTHDYSVASHSATGVISELSATVSIFAPDATAPRVVAATPADGEVNVGATDAVVVKFSEPMDPASINASTITVKDAVSGASFAGTVTYDAVTRTARWTPAPGLPAERRVTAVVSTGVRDAAGNPIAAASSISFTVRELVAPFVVSFSPPNGSIVPIGTLPMVQFSERIRFPGVFGETPGVRMLDFNTRPGQGPSVLQTSTSYDTITNIVTLRHFSRVRSFYTYTIEVNDNVRDLAGNRVKPLNFTLQFGEWTLPAVAATSPSDGATNVSLSAPIFVDLAAPPMPVNDYEPRIDIRATGSNQNIGYVTSYSLGGGTRVTIGIRDRVPNTEYTATFYHFFTDSKGVRQEATTQWRFTTGS